MYSYWSLFSLSLFTFSVLSLPLSDPNTPKCEIGGEWIQPNQRITLGAFVYECELTNNYVRTTVVACLDGDVYYSKTNGIPSKARGEHIIGDRWVEGERPFRYVLECAKVNDTIVRRIAQCFYHSDDGQVKLDEGQEQKVGKALVRCDRTNQFGMQYKVTYEEIGWSSGGDGASESANGTGGNGGGSGNGNRTGTGSGTGSGNANGNGNDGRKCR